MRDPRFETLDRLPGDEMPWGPRQNLAAQRPLPPARAAAMRAAQAARIAQQDAGMLARHEYRSGQRGAAVDDHAAEALALRRRQLELLKLIG